MIKHTPHTVTCTLEGTPQHAPSRGVCRLARLLGVPAHSLNRAQAATTLSIALVPGRISAIVGPSGSGKSTALRSIRGALIDQGYTVYETPQAHAPLAAAPVIDLIRRATGRAESEESIQRAARIAASAGLSDAHVLTSLPAVLSTGERARTHLARTLARCEARSAPTALIIDEFAASLDRAYALSLARSLQRWALRSRTTVVLATNREDLLSQLNTIDEINLGSGTIHTKAPSQSNIVIAPGTIQDYNQLAACHYRMRPPANPARVLVATDQATDTRAGVLVTAYPTLIGRWRQLAWPGRYTGADKRVVAQRLNAELRCITRVAVAPPYRGQGVGRMLAKAYLNTPDTPHTEAVAAMGRFNPFLERAGMTAYRVPIAPRSARLTDALEHAGVQEWRLAMPEALARRIDVHPQKQFLVRELRAYARAAQESCMNERDQINAILSTIATDAGTHCRTAYAASYTAKRSRSGESVEQSNDSAPQQP